MTDILENNRDLYRSRRDDLFLRSIIILKKIISKFPEENGDKHYLTIFQYIENLVTLLDDAKYFASLSISSNNLNLESDIHINEQAYTDLIDTIYTYSKSIKRMYEHEMKLQKFVEENESLENNIIEYVNKIKKNEHALIYENLKNMKERIDNYNVYVCELSIPQEV